MNRLRLRGMQLVYFVAFIQLIAGVISTLICWVSLNQQAAQAAIAGALVAIIPGLMMGWRMERGGDDPEAALGAMYRAEASKFVLSLAGFALIALTAPEYFLQAMLTFMACLVAYWIAIAVN